MQKKKLDIKTEKNTHRGTYKNCPIFRSSSILLQDRSLYIEVLKYEKWSWYDNS